MYNLSYLFLQFMFFSIVGYLAEVIYVSIINKKINFSRGFLIGPYLPIYGVSSVLMIIFLSRYKNDLFALFVMSAFVCSLLEYLTSLVLEKIFKLRWWDYSDKKFNIEGRICLRNSLLFGIGGVLVVKIVNPFLVKYLNMLSVFALEVLALVLLIAFVVDLTLSVFILVRLEINVNKFNRMDATKEIKKEVKQSLEKYTALTIRLLNSFPSLKYPNVKNFENFKASLLKTKEELKKLKQKVDRKIDDEVKAVEDKIKEVEREKQ